MPNTGILIMLQHAGFAGAALALLAWAWQLKHGKEKPLPGVSAYENETALIKDVKTAVEEGKAQAGHCPRVLVIGALGRCGKGAVDLCTKAGLEDILVSFGSNLTTAQTDRNTEMGSCRDQREAWSIPGDSRIRRFCQLHLSLRQDPTFHLEGITSITKAQARRRLRRLLRHHEPTQPNTDLRNQHHIHEAYSTCRITCRIHRSAIDSDQHRSPALPTAKRGFRSVQRPATAQSAILEGPQEYTSMATGREAVRRQGGNSAEVGSRCKQRCNVVSLPLTYQHTCRHQHRLKSIPARWLSEGYQYLLLVASQTVTGCKRSACIHCEIGDMYLLL